MRGVKPEQPDRRRMNPQQHRYSAAELEQRRAGLPKPQYPEELPVSARRVDIAQAIAKHQVVIVCAMSARLVLTGRSSGYSGFGSAARRCSSSAAE